MPSVRASQKKLLPTPPSTVLRDRLERLIEDDRKGRQDEAKLLLGLLAMSNQEKRREEYANSLGLKNVREFAFYGLLSPFREAIFSASEKEQAAFTREVIETIKTKTVIDWTEKEDIKREMRREIKGLLRERGFQEEQVEPITVEIMNLARIHLKDI